MHIYLSPHHDDLCFSLAHRASRTGGELVTAFSVSEYAPVASDLPADRDERIAAVTELRRNEDARFADAAGLNRHELGLPEPSVLGLDPFDEAGLREERDRLAALLLPCIEALLGRTDQRAALYCPMGIGRHRNHLSMLVVVRRFYDVLSERCDLFLYEDLDYASVASARQRGLRLVRAMFAEFELAPIVEELDEAAAARKLEWIRLYASQHRRRPNAARFTPASGLSARPHEIVWRISAPHRR